MIQKFSQIKKIYGNSSKNNYPKIDKNPPNFLSIESLIFDTLYSFFNKKDNTG